MIRVIKEPQGPYESSLAISIIGIIFQSSPIYTGYPVTPSIAIVLGPRRLITGPPIRALKTNTPYRTPFDVSAMEIELGLPPPAPSP
jgi:hypothetical protein